MTPPPHPTTPSTLAILFGGEKQREKNGERTEKKKKEGREGERVRVRAVGVRRGDIDSLASLQFNTTELLLHSSPYEMRSLSLRGSSPLVCVSACVCVFVRVCRYTRDPLMTRSILYNLVLKVRLSVSSSSSSSSSASSHASFRHLFLPPGSLTRFYLYSISIYSYNYIYVLTLPSLMAVTVNIYLCIYICINIYG